MAAKGKTTKVKDLPLDKKVSEKDLKTVAGGAGVKKKNSSIVRR